MRRVVTLTSVLLCLSAACSDSTSPGVTVELTADQANALIARTGQLATATPGLSFLTDSIELVLHAGTKLQQVTITVDGTNASYFAVGLIRQFVNVGTTTSASGTWHMLAFDAITSPTKFVIVNGFASNTSATPPGGASGNFGGSVVLAHVIELSGANVLDWAASTGTATLTAGAQGAACPDFTEFGGVTCFASTLSVTFQITSSSPPSIALPSKTASMSATVIPAVQLRRDSGP